MIVFSVGSPALDRYGIVILIFIYIIIMCKKICETPRHLICGHFKTANRRSSTFNDSENSSPDS